MTGDFSGSIFGRRFFCACHKSYTSCMCSHDSADPRSAAAKRIASSALTAALPLTTRESATRETTKRFANSKTVMPPFVRNTVSLGAAPGGGGGGGGAGGAARAGGGRGGRQN